MGSLKLPCWVGEATPVERLGLAGLMMFAWGTFGGTAAGYLGLLSMLAAALLEAPRVWGALRADKVTLSCVTAIVFLAVTTLHSTQSLPEAAALQRNAGAELASLFLFPLVAWWMRGNPRIVMTVFAVALAGFLYGRAARIDAAAIDLALIGGRVGLGFAGIAFSQYCAAGLVGVSIVLPRVWTHTGLNAGWRIAAAALLSLIWAALLAGLIQGGSRGVYINLLGVAGILWASRRQSPLDSRRIKWWMLAAAGLILAVLTYRLGWFVLARLINIYQEFMLLIESGVDAAEGTTVGLRALMLLAGTDWWLEKPWFGWGPGATEYLIARSGIAPLTPFNDLHNGPLELAVRLGAVGLGVFLTNWILVLRELRRARRASTAPEPLYLIILGCLLLHLIGTLYNFRMLNADWLLYWLLFAGAATTFGLHRGQGG